MPVQGGLASWRRRVRALKQETYALYLAYRHPDTPWYARCLAISAVAYAASPIDLIPDFVPILGYVDDLLLVPLGMALAIRLVPAQVMVDCRRQAAQDQGIHLPAGQLIAMLIILVWLLAMGWFAVRLAKTVGWL